MTAAPPPRSTSRKAAITAAAADLFAERGYDGTSIDEIGAAVGVTGPAIYRHFKGKEALLAAVIDDTIEAFDLEGARAPSLEWLATQGVTAALDRPSRLVTYVRERHRLPGAERARLTEAEHRLYRLWRDAIAIENPALSEAAASDRLWAVLVTMSDAAARNLPAPRPVLEQLLVESMVAVIATPPVPVIERVEEPGGWSLPPGRREQILAAALRLFRERGYHGVSIDEIGEAAGISGPTVYFHYRSKADILTDAHERAGVRVVGAIEAAVASAASASDALDRLALAQLALAAQSGDLIVVGNREIGIVDPVDQERFVQRGIEIVAVWASVLRELRPDLNEATARSAVWGVFPLMNQIARTLGDPAEGVPLVRAWALGRTAAQEA